MSDRRIPVPQVARGPLLAALLLALAPGAVAAQEPLTVPRAPTPPAVDGSLADEAWRSALVLDDWVQTEPGDNVAPSGPTRLHLLHDDEALYVGVEAADPRGIRYTVHPRDQVVTQGQDWVGILLDTFNDRRQAFGFAVNPVGVQGDGIIVEGGGPVEWDAIFTSEGAIAPDGRSFTLEIRIPFRSLRFGRAPVQRWGLGVARMYGRSGATDSPWPLDRDLGCELCQLRTIELAGVVPGRNLELNPALVASTQARQPAPGVALDPYVADFEPSLNLKYGLTSNLTLDGTVNPDFSQVESDAGQLDVNNRFALFFPEKRPFFLEGADIFTTSITPPGSSPFVFAPINLIHSRTILDPDWGVKLSGKAGRLGLGAIVTRDGAEPVDIASGIEGSDVVIARSTMDVLSDGHVGGVLTARRHGGAADVVGGVDTRLRLGPNLTLRGLYAGSRYEAPELEGGPARTGAALQAQANWQSRRWTGGIALIDVGRAFAAPLGFIPRTDQITATGSLGHIWRGTGWLHRVEPQLRYERVYEHAAGGGLLRRGRLVDELWEPSLSFTFARSTSLAVGAHRAFTHYDGRSFPAQDRVGAFAETRAWDRVYLRMSALVGETVIFSDIAGDGSAGPGWMRELSARATFRPVPALSGTLGVGSSTIWRRTPDAPRASLYATALIPRLAVEYQATRRLGIRTIAEWRGSEYHRPTGAAHAETERLSAELLASYVINAGSAIYVGWTELQGGDLEHALAPARRGGVAKATYVWRF